MATLIHKLYPVEGYQFDGTLHSITCIRKLTVAATGADLVVMEKAAPDPIQVDNVVMLDFSRLYLRNRNQLVPVNIGQWVVSYKDHEGKAAPILILNHEEVVNNYVKVLDDEESDEQPTVH